MSLPLVSIVCLTYNHEKFIRDAIQGFLIQKTTFPIEIIIHDDASTDRTQSIIKEYEIKYPDLFKPIYQEQNQKSKGDGIVTRIAFGAAQGKYLALCEGDDYWTDPNKLQKQVDFLETNLDFILVAHPSQAIYENQAKPPELYNKLKKNVLRKKDIIPSYLFQLASVMFRNEALKKIDLYGIMVEHSLYILLSQYGKFKVLPEVMSVYRIHSSGVSGTSTPQKAYPGQLSWIRNLKRIMGSDFFWGYHFLTSKVHTYYAIKHPEVFNKGTLYKYYYFLKYAFLMLIFYPRNIRSVFRMIPQLIKSKTIE